MGIVSLVLGLLIVTFAAVIVIAQIRSEARTRQGEEKEENRQGRRAEPSHEKARTREWWI